MRILLVRLRLIGDVVLTTPVVRALRKALPSSELSYLVEPVAAPVVAASPYLDEVIVARRGRGTSRVADDLRLARELRRRRYDLAIDFHGGPRASMLTWVSGARRRIGYDVAGRWWMYTERVPRDADPHRRHSVAKQWDLVKELHQDLARLPSRETDPVEMPESPEATHAVARRLAEWGVGPSDEVIVVHVGAGNRFRQWPEAAFADLVGRLSDERPDRRIILTTGVTQAPMARAVVDGLARTHPGVGARVAAWCDLELSELRSLISRADLFVGGDSGPLHIAATTATPIVVLYGPTLATVWAPWRDPRLVTEVVEVDGLPCRPCDQRVCATGDFRCLGWLPPAQVAEAARRALARAAATRKTTS